MFQVTVTVGERGKLDSPETDVVEGFVIETESFVRVFVQLMD